MNTFGERLTSALKNAKMTQQQLADRLGIKQQSVQHACSSRAKGSKHSLKMAEILEVNAGWLSHGIGDSFINSRNLQSRLDWYNSVDKNITKGNVPLIDMSDVPHIENLTEFNSIACAAPHSSTSYAIRVNDNTMTAQYGRSYPEGCIIFVDPEKAEAAENGDRVIALLETKEGKKISTFKQYGEANGQQYLQPLNIQYPVITQEFEIVGLVIGMWVEEN